MGPITMFALVLYTYADLSTTTIRYYADHSECRQARHRLKDQLDPHTSLADCVVIIIPRD